MLAAFIIGYIIFLLVFFISWKWQSDKIFRDFREKHPIEQKDRKSYSDNSYTPPTYTSPDVYNDIHYDVHQHITVDSRPTLPLSSSRFLDVDVHEPTGKVIFDGIDSTITLFGDILSGKI